MMLLWGVASAVALAAYRASRRGIDPDIIYSLAPWTFIGGIGGARLFYVIQYRDKFDSIADMFKFTEGGLVVYGSFIGGTIAAIYYIYRHQLPLLKVGDVIVPCLFIGVFFGRIGCLMNGCCYGGRCEEHWASVQFPPTSQVYHEQVLKSGELLGLDYDQQTFRVKTVSQGSLASEAGIQPGASIQSIRYGMPELTDALRLIPKDDVQRDVIAEIGGQTYRWTPEQLPDRALPVYAVQLLSSLSSLILCLTLCGLGFFVTRDGAIMMIGFASYAVVRFMLELIRVDEGGQFGTNLSISQWVSVVVFAVSMAGLVFVYRRPVSNETVQAQPSVG
jgi:phosphatidylglycerol:prolipoprotein diacylglycerol transferase